MLVILQNENILSTTSICQQCLWANQTGKPRWQEGKLGCGQCLTEKTSDHPQIYKCQMGFHLANIE